MADTIVFVHAYRTTSGRWGWRLPLRSDDLYGPAAGASTEDLTFSSEHAARVSADAWARAWGYVPVPFPVSSA
jgi:hypothetical protein